MQTEQVLQLQLLSGEYAICRLDPSCPTPEWAERGEFSSVTRTCEELSIVCAEDLVPDQVSCARGWRMLKLAGPIPFTVTGVVAAISSALARNRIGIFVVSTYDTDYILVQAHALSDAIVALESGGCIISR